MPCRWLILLSICLFGPFVSAAAQPLRGAVEPIPPEIAVMDLVRAYQEHTIAEEVTMRLRQAAGPDRTESFIVRIQNDKKTPGDPRQILLELGPLRIHAGDGLLTAVSAAAPGKCFVRELPRPLTAQSLLSALPPLAVPQVVLATARDEQFTAPTPYTGRIRWSEALVDASARPPSVSLKGASRTADIAITSIRDTGRLLKLVATVHARGGDTVLDMTIRGISAGDPAEWKPDTEGKERVASIRDLAPASQPPRPIQVGEPVPEFVMSQPDHAAWSLSAALDRLRADRPDAAPALLAIVLFRESAPTAFADAAAGFRAVATATVSGPGNALTRPRIFAAAGAVVELGRFTPDRWASVRQAWDRDASTIPIRPAPGYGELLWASSPAAIDRVAPDAGAVLICISPDRTLRAVIRLDGRAGEPEAINNELREAIRPLVDLSPRPGPE